MNREEAVRAIAEVALKYLGRTYADLTGLIGNPESTEIAGATGAIYQVEVNAVWDDVPEKMLRLVFAVDDGNMRGLIPLTCDGFVAPGTAFDGELG